MANKKISDLPLKAIPGPNDIIPIVDTSSQPFQTKRIAVSSLASVGAPGADGATGATGVQGPAGVAGVDGADGATGATGVQGPEGATGPAGSGVTIKGTALTWPPDVNPDAGDMWILGYVPVEINGSPGDGVVWTGTSWENVGPIRGPQGEPGATGVSGAQGADGATGATGAQGLRAFEYSPLRVFENQYTPGEIVFYNGGYYICLANNDAIPPVGEALGVYWGAYSFTGPAGVAGPQGATGPQGNPATNLVSSVNGQTGAVTVVPWEVPAFSATDPLQFNNLFFQAVASKHYVVRPTFAGSSGGIVTTRTFIDPPNPTGGTYYVVHFVDSVNSYIIGSASTWSAGTRVVRLYRDGTGTGSGWSNFVLSPSTGATGATGPAGNAGAAGAAGATGATGVAGATGPQGPASTVVLNIDGGVPGTVYASASVVDGGSVV